MIYAVGDLHFGMTTQAFPQRQLLAMQTEQLIDILEIANSNRADVVLLGDIFDHARPTQQAVAAFLRAILDERFRDLPIHIYAGNHDIDGEHHALEALQVLATAADADIRVYMKNTTVLSTDKIKMEFLNYPHARGDSENSIVFSHNEFKGSRRDNGTLYEHATPFDNKRANDRNQYFVSGHLHTMQEYPRLIYPGTPNATNFYYPRQHYLLAINPADNKNICRDDIELVEFLPHWHLWRCDVGNERDEDHLAEILEIGSETALRPEYVKIKAVVAEGWALAKDLADDPRIIVDTAPKKTMFPQFRVEPGSKKGGTDLDWVTSNLPDYIRNNRRKLLIAEALISKAQGNV